MINPEAHDSHPLTFSERIEKIQNTEVIPKFVDNFKIGRSDIQIWENYEPELLTSSYQGASVAYTTKLTPSGHLGYYLADQKPSTSAVHNLTEQGPSTTAGNNLTEQGPSTKAGNNLTEQGPSTTAGNNLTEQGPSTTAGSNLTEQGPSTTAGNNLTEQGPSTTAGNNLTEQGPSTTAGNNLTEQGPLTSAGNNLNDQGPSTSTGNNLKTARHHAIPGDILRDAFFHMLSNQKTWPYMVQMLNAALENLRHHKSSTRIDGKFIDDAQEALDLFDARIEKCNFNFDSESFEKALEYLLAVFYWSPFNIYYGPLPFMRAPADVGNKLDKDLFPGINIAVTVSLLALEEQLKKLEINELTVKVYIINLCFHPKPKLAGSYRKLTLSFDDFLKECFVQILETSFTADELNQMVEEIKKDQFFSQNELSLLSHLQKEWISKLEVGGACNRCLSYAKESLIKEVENYKCKSKKCPIYSAQPKYALYSNVNDSSSKVAKEIFQGTSQYYSTLDVKKGADVISEDVTNIITYGHNFEYTMSQPETALTFIFSANLTTDFDREYIRLKRIRMRNKPVTLAEIYGPHLPMRVGANCSGAHDLLTARRLASLPHDKMLEPFWHPG